jgi:hypothetical protein
MNRPAPSFANTWRSRAQGLVLLASLCAPATGRAEGEAFGAQGQRVPFGGVGLELALAAGAPGTGDEIGRDLSVHASPGVLYFFAPDLLAGVSLDARYSDYELRLTPYEEIELGPSVGFGVHVPLSDRIGFLPRLWLGGGYAWRRYAAVPAPAPPLVFADPSFMAQREPERTVEGAFASAQLLLPLVLHLARGTFISVGPHARLRLAFERGQRLFRFGLSAGIGRYF